MDPVDALRERIKNGHRAIFQEWRRLGCRSSPRLLVWERAQRELVERYEQLTKETVTQCVTIRAARPGDDPAKLVTTRSGKVLRGFHLRFEKTEASAEDDDGRVDPFVEAREEANAEPQSEPARQIHKHKLIPMRGKTR